MERTLLDQLKSYFSDLRIRLVFHRNTGRPDLSEAAVARKAGMHPVQFSRLVNHPGDVKVSTIMRIEEALEALTRESPDVS